MFVLVFYCSVGDTDADGSECSGERGTRVKTTTDVSDSGISENACFTSSQSAASLVNAGKLSRSTDALVITETTPLLIPNKKGMDQKSNNKMIASAPAMAHNQVPDTSSPIDILSEGSYIEESCIQTRESFPNVLKTVCFTGQGAVEV